VQTSLCYVQSFWHNTGVWQTDRRTVGQTDGRTENATVRACNACNASIAARSENGGNRPRWFRLIIPKRVLFFSVTNTKWPLILHRFGPFLNQRRESVSANVRRWKISEFLYRVFSTSQKLLKWVLSTIVGCFCAGYRLSSTVFLWSPYGIGQTIIFSSGSFFFFLLLSYFPRVISAVGDWMSAILPHMVWP